MPTAITSTIQLVPLQAALTDVLRCLLGAERPGDGTAVADLMIRCHQRDVAFPLELAADLTVQCLLVPLNGQEEVGRVPLRGVKPEARMP